MRQRIEHHDAAHNAEVDLALGMKHYDQSDKLQDTASGAGERIGED